MTNPEIRTVEEAYSSAVSTSNLKVGGEDHVGDCDKIMAAGMSKHTLGTALLRLHSEYDGVEHPRLAIAAQFWDAAKRDLINEAKKSGQDHPTEKQVSQLAHERAHAYNLHETGLLLQKLKTLPEVRTMLVTRAISMGIVGADEKTARVIRWWLNQACQACGGTKFEVVPGTNRLGAEHCGKCKGTGLQKVPCGEEGRKLASYIDECLQAARDSIRRRLRKTMGRSD